MKTIIRLGIVTFALGIAFIAIQHIQQHSTNNGLTIGILQTAHHPALDLARQGFEELLRQKLGDRINFLRQNADGSIVNAHLIAQNFHTNKTVAAILTIATPATQAAAAIEKEKPVIFSVVTDPDSLDLFKTNHNVCGSSDMIDVPGLVTLLKQLISQAKTVAILFNPAEANSQILVQRMRHELKNNNLEPIDVGITTESEIAQAVTIACHKADALWAPTDNLIATAIKTVSAIARNHKKPLIVSDNLLVKEGALAARGIDFRDCGKQAAEQAIDVLIHGKKPEILATRKQTQNTIFINKACLQHLNLSVPKELEHENITWI